MPAAIWSVAGGVLLLTPVLRFLYGRYLHPAWRKEHCVLRICGNAFGEGNYRIERLQTRSERPSAADLLPPPLGSADPFLYFVYSVEPANDEDPDVSELSWAEVSLLHRCLSRVAEEVPHQGKEVLRPKRMTGVSSEAPGTPSQQISPV